MFPPSIVTFCRLDTVDFVKFLEVNVRLPASIVTLLRFRIC